MLKKGSVHEVLPTSKLVNLAASVKTFTIAENNKKRVQGSEHTRYCLVGCDDFWYGSILPNLHRNVLLPSSMHEIIFLPHYGASNPVRQQSSYSRP